ncbi:MAG: hypothetical protein LBH28_02035 [Oscillospiraceae bacterium]|nr:hypothetical protein [Oscillospiraceae bacterium]
MQTVLLLMQRKPVAQSLMRKMHGTAGIGMIHEIDYAKAVTCILPNTVGVALVEISESGRPDVDCCLALCARLRSMAPGCKLLLMCPEHDRAAVMAIITARLDGSVDDFLFCNATIDFIEAKIMSFLSTRYC